MDEKRFIEFATQNTDNGEINNGFNDIETGGWFYTKDSENAEKICGLLNELHKENEHLKQSFKEVLKDLEVRTFDKELLEEKNEQLQQQLNYIQNSISEHIKHQKTELGQKALKEIIEDYNEWLLGHKEVVE